MIQVFIFLILTGCLVLVSRRSIVHPGSHGFFRFFAWEAILALILLNIDHWFEQPLSTLQVLSWILLLISLYMVIEGAYRLRRGGGLGERKSGDELFPFERTTTLVTDGVYRYIRHPLYSSLLFLAWGVFFKLPSLPGAILTLAATLFLDLTGRADEHECIIFFGRPYELYMEKTKRFIPFLF